MSDTRVCRGIPADSERGVGVEGLCLSGKEKANKVKSILQLEVK